MKFLAFKQGNIIHIAPKDRAEFLSDGEYQIDMTKPRNYEFLKKYFALLNTAFELWESPDGVIKSFDNFRDEVTIGAGYYEQVWSIGGILKLIPKSISFSKMDEAEFEKVYSNTIDYILWHVLPKHDRKSLIEAEEKIMAFF